MKSCKKNNWWPSSQILNWLLSLVLFEGKPPDHPSLEGKPPPFINGEEEKENPHHW
jgi:hypothetical protein